MREPWSPSELRPFKPSALSCTATVLALRVPPSGSRYGRIPADPAFRNLIHAGAGS
ncbi:MAG: hypothetical protein JWN34_4629 [Bryobacterales bacterium]|nr:hypothetical protein [Bryobacterales bacterium]